MIISHSNNGHPFSRTAGYAVRAVLVLAQRQANGPVSSEDIADAIGAPRNYLGKTLNSLVRQGILQSVRGPHGGFTLAVSPQRLTVADIVNVFVEPSSESSPCLLANHPCNADQPCIAHKRWNALTVEAQEPLMRTTIAEFCELPALQADNLAVEHLVAVTS
jgi:Rrf2 family transcriptional regulator, iron-sulfur cluster assembly transcription factor